MHHLAVPTDKGTTGPQLHPVNSGHLRQLSGKMLIPNSRIRLLDTLGHGKIATLLISTNTYFVAMVLCLLQDCAMDMHLNCGNHIVSL